MMGMMKQATTPPSLTLLVLRVVTIILPLIFFQSIALSSNMAEAALTPDGMVQALRAAIPVGRIHVRGSPEYERLNGGYLSGLESDLRPYVIFQPTSVAEVAAFVRILKPFVDIIDCAIRGAGQQPLPGCANVNNGITLDLGLLNSITLQNQNSVVQLGAGVRWGKVYEKLDPLGLSVTGSRSAAGGVGGLALAGSLRLHCSSTQDRQIQVPQLIEVTLLTLTSSI